MARPVRTPDGFERGGERLRGDNRDSAAGAPAGDGIVSAFVERMALHNAPQRQPRPSRGAVRLDGLQRVSGARRSEAAFGRERTRDMFPVEHDERDKYLFHIASPRRGGGVPAAARVPGARRRYRYAEPPGQFHEITRQIVKRGVEATLTRDYDYVISRRKRPLA